MATRGETRTEQVYRALRSDIIDGRLAPGSRLPFAELSERYGSSTSAIREGLQRLVEQGLVDSEPQQGFRVTGLSVEDLDDLTDARCEIEGIALRLSIEHGDLAWESSVVAAWHVLERTSAADAADAGALRADWVAAHRAFHEALYGACPNRRIRAMATSLRDAAELYHRWSYRATYDDRDVDAEHRAIVDAVLAGDADLAVTRLRDHLDATRRALAELAVDAEPVPAPAGGPS